MEILRISNEEFTPALFDQLLQQAVDTKTWMTDNIYESRLKDYQNEFRKMIYDNDTEMDKVIGKLEDNVFINQQQEELQAFKEKIKEISSRFSLSMVASR